MIGFGDASTRFFTRAFDFQGRSSRAEYWWAYLMLILAAFAISLVIGILGEAGTVFLLLFYVATLIPSLAIAIRRLHDTDRSGWWLLISLVPLVGFIALLIFYCSEGTKGPNRFGEDPYGNVSPDVFN